MNYKPGLHILLTIRDIQIDKLKEVDNWIVFVNNLIQLNKLQSLGHIQHTFEELGGYTAVHCLTESHISIHTWPEFQLCTCDVFLSNFTRNNEDIVKKMSQSIVQFFGSLNYELKEISR